MRPFQIYRIKVTWKNSEDPRPWLVVQTRPDGVFGCFPISSRCYGQDCFPVDSSHSDFSATGLSGACYIICTTIYDLKQDQFMLDGKQQLKGELAGELLRAFRDFAAV